MDPQKKVKTLSTHPTSYISGYVPQLLCSIDQNQPGTLWLGGAGSFEVATWSVIKGERRLFITSIETQHNSSAHKYTFQQKMLSTHPLALDPRPTTTLKLPHEPQAILHTVHTSRRKWETRRSCRGRIAAASS
ncbi:unnamed protein product, partial [Ectocarpus sp. 4 AP-2014]